MNTSHWRLIATITIALFICVGALAVALAVLVAGREYDPLGEYPVQRVDSKLVGFDTPSLRLSSGEVVVTATKCAKHETKVNGTSSWVELAPGGEIVALAAGTAVRTGGCTTKTYRNDIPPSVMSRVVRLAMRGVTQSQWQIAGIETPVSSDGRSGIPRPWQTQNFTIVYDEEPT